MAKKTPANRTQSPAVKPAPAAGLSAESQELRERLTREWSIVDSSGQIVLLTALQALDRLRQAQEIIAKEGITIRDRWNQPKVHPASIIEREARAGFLSSMKLLNLDLESLVEGDEA